ncbi:MAG: proteasome subunit beta [Leptospirillia bacterium]
MTSNPFSPAQGSSFFDYLAAERPDLLPANAASASEAPLAVSHGTTVLAMTFTDGVVIAGDRMASDGHSVASRRVDKVIRTDTHSALAISGAVGPCLEMAKLFATELEFFEKIEGRVLSLSGKSNKLGQMVRGNLTLAMQGLAVIPLFAGYDLEKGVGRVFKYDVAGGRTEEQDYVSTGSGGGHARSALKSLYRAGMSEQESVAVALEALFDAAEEDLATAGPDAMRGIYPLVMVIDRDGVRELPKSDIAAICARIAGSEGGA